MLTVCSDYVLISVQSLLPPVEKEDPFIPYYIAAAGAALLIGMCVALFYANKRQKKFGYVFFPDGKHIHTADGESAANCLL